MTLGELGERMSAQEFDLWCALGRTVSEIEQDMPSSELTEWMAYYRL